jgi:hypothetical protein
MKRRVAVATIALLATAWAAAATAGPTPAQKCQAAKLKEVAKYDSCRLKAEAKGVIKGEPADMTKCDGKFGVGWAKAEAQGQGQCPTMGDQSSIGADVTAHTDEIALLLSGVFCGNGTVEGAEECDMTDFDGATCADYSFDSGSLVCTPSCTIDSTGCFDSCDPLAQTCPVAQACYILGNAAVCAGEGSATVGQACTFANSCAEGLACDDSVCVEICDLTSPVCSVGTCTNINFTPYPDTGLCL